MSGGCHTCEHTHALAWLGVGINKPRPSTMSSSHVIVMASANKPPTSCPPSPANCTVHGRLAWRSTLLGTLCPSCVYICENAVCCSVRRESHRLSTTWSECLPGEAAKHVRVQPTHGAGGTGGHGAGAPGDTYTPCDCELVAVSCKALRHVSCLSSDKRSLLSCPTRAPTPLRRLRASLTPNDWCRRFSSGSSGYTRELYPLSIATRAVSCEARHQGDVGVARESAARPQRGEIDPPAAARSLQINATATHGAAYRAGVKLAQHARFLHDFHEVLRAHAAGTRPRLARLHVPQLHGCCDRLVGRAHCERLCGQSAAHA